MESVETINSSCDHRHHQDSQWMVVAVSVTSKSASATAKIAFTCRSRDNSCVHTSLSCASKQLKPLAEGEEHSLRQVSGSGLRFNHFALQATVHSALQGVCRKTIGEGTPASRLLEASCKPTGARLSQISIPSPCLSTPGARQPQPRLTSHFQPSALRVYRQQAPPGLACGTKCRTRAGSLW